MCSQGPFVTTLFKFSRKARMHSPLNCSNMLKLRSSRTLLRKFALKLSQKLKRKYKNTGFDFILPVPLHKKREKARGFNQAVIIAETAGKILNIPVKDKAVKRIKETKELKYLPFYGRKKEIQGSFVIKRGEKIKGKKILILDDVVASGSTIGQITDLLLRSGANFIGAAAIFRVIN